MTIHFAEDDKTLPKFVPKVPLIELFPTVEQNCELPYIRKTADILNDLRYLELITLFLICGYFSSYSQYICYFNVLIML